MKIQIPHAHGEAIDQRNILMRQVMQQFHLLRAEDKRHVDAVLKSLNLNPAEYDEYNLTYERPGAYFLELTQPHLRPDQVTPSDWKPKTNGQPELPLVEAEQ